MLDVAHVQESLRRLSATHADVFGANGHHFQLNSVLDDMEILAFEQRRGRKEMASSECSQNLFPSLMAGMI